MLAAPRKLARPSPRQHAVVETPTTGSHGPSALRVDDPHEEVRPASRRRSSQEAARDPVARGQRVSPSPLTRLRMAAGGTARATKILACAEMAVLVLVPALALALVLVPVLVPVLVLV